VGGRNQFTIFGQVTTGFGGIKWGVEKIISKGREREYTPERSKKRNKILPVKTSRVAKKAVLEKQEEKKSKKSGG